MEGTFIALSAHCGAPSSHFAASWSHFSASLSNFWRCFRVQAGGRAHLEGLQPEPRAVWPQRKSRSHSGLARYLGHHGARFHKRHLRHNLLPRPSSTSPALPTGHPALRPVEAREKMRPRPETGGCEHHRCAKGAAEKPCMAGGRSVDGCHGGYFYRTFRALRCTFVALSCILVALVCIFVEPLAHFSRPRRGAGAFPAQKKFNGCG